MVEAGIKRKRPPTFQHLPINRAKKLKRTWVETVKIKSRWKAQKRKEGLAQLPSTTPHGHVSSEGEEKELDEKSESTDAEDREETEEQPARKESTIHPSRAHLHSNLALKSGSGSNQKGTEKDNVTLTASVPSVRDLTREAYSQSSLHTYKSDPLNRRHGSSSRGRWKGKEVQAVRGRGQPNMKLRMNAMLEKIKRDLT